MAACLAGFLVGAAAAQQLESRTYRMIFPAGSTGLAVSENVTGEELVNYRITARTGQVLTVTLDPPTNLVFFQVFRSGRDPTDVAMADSAVVGRDVPAINRYSAILAQTGDYLVSIRNARSAAIGNRTSPFTLQVSVTSGAAQLPGGLPAAGNAQPAAFLQVTGIASSDHLNVRSGPSTGKPVLFTLRNGEIVGSLGCTGESSSRWCQVHRAGRPAPVGWASARYLVAARNPGHATHLPALKPSTSSGTLPCTLFDISLKCAFRVSRTGAGNAVLTVIRPLGPTREITFEAGRPISSNSSGGVLGEWSGSTVNVTVGTKERYVVRQEILFER